MADRQDRAALKTNEVGPIKPSKKAPKASVKEAAKAAEAVSQHTGAAAKAAKKQALRDEADKISSLEEKIEMLTQLVALQMQGEQSTSVKAESLEELPFQL